MERAQAHSARSESAFAAQACSFLELGLTSVDRYANVYPCRFMLSRDLGHELLRSLQFVEVLLGLVAEGTCSIPNVASSMHCFISFILRTN